MESRREGVIAGLAEVDVVVGVHRTLATHNAAGQLNRPVGDHLIDVHVGLGARARLPNLQGELGIQAAGCHLFSGGHDQAGELWIQLALGAIHLGAGRLELAEGVHHSQGHGLAKGKEVDRSLGLGAPVVVLGNLNSPQAVGFDPVGQVRLGHQRLTTSAFSSLKLTVVLVVPPSGKGMPVALLTPSLMRSTSTRPLALNTTFPAGSNTTTWGMTPSQ